MERYAALDGELSAERDKALALRQEGEAALEAARCRWLEEQNALIEQMEADKSEAEKRVNRAVLPCDFSQKCSPD